MPREVISARSVAEAYLYVFVTPCSMCRHGAREVSVLSGAPESAVFRLVSACGNCAGTEEFFFSAPGSLPSVDPLSSSQPLNPTADASTLIDVGQWLTLHQCMLERAEETPDPSERRWRRFRAVQCLDEALKFYGADSELPPESAFFADSSRRAFREHPQRFARSRLLDLRARLPDVEVEAKVARQVARVGRQRRWWKFW